MESTFDSQPHGVAPEAPKSASEYIKELFSASSGSAAWESFKNLIEATPTWALVAGALGVVTVVANPWLLSFGLGAGALLTASYFTTKHAIRTAMQEHDRQRR